VNWKHSVSPAALAAVAPFIDQGCQTGAWVAAARLSGLVTGKSGVAALGLANGCQTGGVALGGSGWLDATVTTSRQNPLGLKSIW
jgi:hypothetical protein